MHPADAADLTMDLPDALMPADDGGLLARCCRAYATAAEPMAPGVGFFHEDRECSACGTSLRVVFHRERSAGSAYAKAARFAVVAMMRLG